MKVKELSIDELRALIEEIVEEKLKEMVEDADWGLELKAEVRKRLKRSLEASKKGERGVPAEEVARRFGVD